MSEKIYEIVTEKILAALEAGTVPWRRPWNAGGAGGSPVNHATGKPYRGINWFLLSIQSSAYSANRWLTFKQAAALGGTVRKGEKSTLVVFWRFFEPAKDKKKRKPGEQPRRVPMLRYYNVFNIDQCEGIDYAPAAAPVREFSPIESADSIWNGYANRPTLAHGGGRAYYRPGDDHIQMPARESFVTDADYYQTLFHEVTHSTGNARRLARKAVGGSTFGDHLYSEEELVAEFGSAFLMAEAGLAPDYENTAAYIDGWRRAIRANPRWSIAAAGAAQRAADLVMGRTFSESAGENETAAAA